MIYKKKISTIALITILTLSIIMAAIPMASAAPLTGVTATPTDATAGETTIYTIAFTTVGALAVAAPADQILITFPSGFDASAAAVDGATVTQSGTDPTLVSATATLVTLDVAANEPAGAQSIVLSGIVNTETTGATYTVSVETQDGAAVNIDGPTDSGVFTIDPAALDYFTFDLTNLGDPALATQGQILSGTIPVEAYDEYDNLKTDYTGTPVLTSTDILAVLSDPAAFVSGAGTILAADVVFNTFGSQKLTLTDGTISAVSSPITVGAELLIPASAITVTGNVGDKITVYGTAEPFSTVTVYWESLSGQVLATVGADPSGDFDVKVTIPSAVTGANHYIVANDGTDTLSAIFDVDASLSVAGVPPVRVLPGDSFTLTGHGYAKNKAITVTLDDNGGDFSTVTITTPTITTNATGSFSAVIVIPSTIIPAEYDVYTVTATDPTPTAATASITIDYYVTVTPTSGPTGITITISGRIPASTDYSLLIDSTTILTGTSGSDTRFSQTYTIPPLTAVMAHTVYVKWTVATVVNTREATFTVTAAPTLTKIDPPSDVPGATITISGKDFCAGANITAYISTTIVNSTQLDARFGPTVAFGPFAGTFTNLEFTVPALAPGLYTLTVVDEYGASTGTTHTFTVLPAPVTTIALRATSYYRGDTLSFNIVTTETSLGTITVTVNDPAGATWWTTTAWLLTPGILTQSVLYQDQLFGALPATLPADASLGSWNWTITYTPASTTVLTKATGLFAVSALPTMDNVLAKVDELGTNMTSLLNALDAKITSIDGAVATISTKVGTIQTTVSGLDAKITSINNGMATAQTSLGTVQTSLESLDAVLEVVAGDTATIKTSIGTFETSLDALDATITVIGDDITAMAGDIVTIKTSIGTINGTITSIEDGIATIDTEVGTIQADVTALQTDVAAIDVSVDMTPIWIAVVLSMVAAIAACYAVITIRQKIAG